MEFPEQRESSLHFQREITGHFRRMCSISKKKGDIKLRKNEVQYCTGVAGTSGTLRRGDREIASAHQAQRRASPKWSGSEGTGPSLGGWS